MTRTIDNTDDVIDSREVIERIEELREDRDGYEIPATPEPESDTDASRARWAEEFTYDAAELAALLALQEEAEGYAPDWKDGATLVRDSYFTEYAMELLVECGDLPSEIPHYIVIDEDATARNIRQDYTAVEFGTVTYWVH